MSGILETLVQLLCVHFVVYLEHADDFAGIKVGHLAFIAENALELGSRNLTYVSQCLHYVVLEAILDNVAEDFHDLMGLIVA